jgi:hypothetical protein
MNKPKPKFYEIFSKSLFLFFLSFILLISCDKQEDEHLLQSNSNNVNQKTALDIAQSFFKSSNTTSKGINNTKTIDNIILHKTKKNKDAFYVINYKEGGFLVLSADNRINPILAFSDTNTFSSTPGEIIPPIQDWIKGEKEQVDYVIDHNYIQSKNVKLEWEKVTANNATQIKHTKTSNETGGVSGAPGQSEYNCPDTTIEKGPLMTTYWGQLTGYNNLIPYDCPLTHNNIGKAPTGCVATAMAQIMRYFHKPNTYNWGNMQDWSYGIYTTYDIQLLMKDAGSAVHMNYGCTESSAYARDIVPALKNTFGYSSASYTTTYNSNIITSNLNANKPVILCGSGSYGGHAWVCDGYSLSTFYGKDEDGKCNGTAVSMLSLHMNWGWDSYYNGYYAYDNFNPSFYTFNNNRSIIYNINL